MRIWDTVKMELLWTIRAHGDHVTTVDWSPSEPLALASGGWDRKFKFWAITSEQASACRGLSRNCSAHGAERNTPGIVWWCFVSQVFHSVDDARVFGPRGGFGCDGLEHLSIAGFIGSQTSLEQSTCCFLRCLYASAFAGHGGLNKSCPLADI